MKKLTSIFIALVMLVAMVVPAAAAQGDLKITITNTDTASSKGHVYKAYQIFDGDLDSTQTVLSSITWGKNITNGDAFIAALKDEADFEVNGVNIFASADTAAEVAAAFSLPANRTSTIIEAFARIATEKKTGEPVAISTSTDAPYVITIPADYAGYYLVSDTIEDGINKDVSDFILQVSSANTTVEHKGSVPTLDKTVSETGSTYHEYIPTGIGDVHYYRLVAELPDDYYAYDWYYLEFTDTLSKGLTFCDVVAVKALIRSGNTDLEIDPECYEYTFTPNDDGTTDFKVAFSDLKTNLTSDDHNVILTAASAIEVIYKATVNTDAVVDGNGIPNKANLIFSNNPNDENSKGTTPDEETNVYPINLKVLKNDGKATTTKLAGAEFVLGREYSTGIEEHMEWAVVIEGNLIKWVEHYEGDTCTSTDEKHTAAEKATVLITDANGNIAVSGLDANKFYLKELKAPDGYNKLLEDVVFSVNITVDDAADVISGMSGTTRQGAITFEPTTATVTITIPNFKGDVLPSTGGMGTTLFYTAGGAMVLFAVVMLITKKRMNEE